MTTTNLGADATPATGPAAGAAPTGAKAAPTQRRPTVFEALGGENAVAAAVDALYDRLLADPVTAPYFDGVDMRRLNGHLRIFLVAALGGPAVYRGRDLGAAHASLGITSEAWDHTVDHLVAGLVSLSVSAPTIDDVLAHLAPLKPMIVTR
jgi:hemoglobin